MIITTIATHKTKQLRILSQKKKAQLKNMQKLKLEAEKMMKNSQF